MEKWLRRRNMKRKTNDTGDANPNCDTRVVTTSKCDDRSTIKVEEASSQRENTVGIMKVHIWNWGLFSVVMRVNKPHNVFCILKCCRTSA
jgi:hypothetical protein